ncbi:hypothetical protein XCR1_930015 [Xenorhabdus cabanillasii JM26]|uniref:Uncharacterized protein n=1 Tax=Xenorhabdus cabanillasii JM26 TaxID=1427517 RepID=W1JCN7_9GAMM|nr:hypothetical protein XCR1_930015 [Xenorhabdus cabanillasii JM26]
MHWSYDLAYLLGSFRMAASYTRRLSGAFINEPVRNTLLSGKTCHPRWC